MNHEIPPELQEPALKIFKFQSDLSRAVSDYCESQKDQWAKLPALACRAEALVPEGTENLRDTYQSGLHPIDSKVLNSHNQTLYVQCGTGLIVDGTYAPHSIRPANTDQIILLANDLESITAANVIQKLRELGENRSALSAISADLTLSKLAKDNTLNSS